MPQPRQPEAKTIPGTSITESAMERMLRHNRELVGPAADAGEIDHARIAENINNSRPVLLPGVAGPAPVVRASRVTERALKLAGGTTEGVQGTSPTPGQDNIDYIPPTTSNTADPANIPAKGPDAENQPASRGVSKKEQMVRDIATLFSEGENPFAKDGEGDGKDGEGDEDDKDGKDGEGDGKDDNPDDKDGKDGDGKDGKDGKDGDGDEEPVAEAVEVHCNECGYDETYDLSEASLAEGHVPLTTEGKLDNKCPMCGADMDLSMIGATNVGEIGDPNPRTDARGNSGQPQESVSADAIRQAQSLMKRVVEGESIESVTKFVVESDFMTRKANQSARV